LNPIQHERTGLSRRVGDFDRRFDQLTGLGEAVPVAMVDLDDGITGVDARADRGEDNEADGGVDFRIQAIAAGADEALMLDPHGFVATCNSTHFFIVRKGEVWTSSGDYCLGGITRANVILLCRANGIPVFEKNFSLTDVYGAEEAFVTGTFAGVVPVREIDGRHLTDGRGPMTERLQQLYRTRIEEDVASAQRP
jgi:hypothetical protein